MRRDPNLTRLVVTGGVVVMLLGGCTGARDDAADDAPALSAAAAPTTSTVATTTTPTTAQSEEQAILAAYQGYLDTWVRANDPPNPSDLGLSRFFVGNARATALEEITKNQQLGMVLRLPSGSRFGFTVESLDIGPDGATLMVCLVDDGLIIDQQSGKVLNNAVSSSRIRATLLHVPDGWAVAEHDYMAKFPGAGGCLG